MTALTRAREFVEAQDRIYSKHEMLEIVRGLLAEIERLQEALNMIVIGRVQNVTFNADATSLPPAE